MLFTIYLSRLAGPCQRWLAGGGRAAAELPCPGHSHGDTDGDRTPRADCVAGTEAGGHEPARQPRLHVLQASPKGKALPLSSLLPPAPALLRAPRQPRGDEPATLCNLPAERPRTGPGASAAHGIPERGPTHASASYLGPRVATAPSPRAGPQHFGTQPGTPRGRTRAPPHRLPAPSSSLHRLPPAASVPVLVTG